MILCFAFIPAPPNITSIAVSETPALPNTNITIDCSLLDEDISPQPTFSWLLNTTTLPFSTSIITITLNETSFGSYTCITSNIVGTDTATITVERAGKYINYNTLMLYFYVYLVGPVLLSSLENQTVISPQNFTLNCTVSGNPLPDITWYKSFNGSNETIISNVFITEYQGLNTVTSIVMFDNTTAKNMGLYICEANNFVNTARYEVTVDFMGKYNQLTCSLA